MRVGFICAFGPGMGHVKRCLALRDELERRGHDIACGHGMDIDWLVVDSPNWSNWHLNTLPVGINVLVVQDAARNQVDHGSTSCGKNDIVIRPYLQPHLAWVGECEPNDSIQMGMSPRGLRLRDAIFDMQLPSEFTLSRWVIGSPGHSSWERCAYGVPTMHVIFTEGHRIIADVVEKAGAGVRLWDCMTEGEPTERELVRRIYDVMDKHDSKAMGKAAHALCDGYGCSRTVDMMEASLC